MTAETATRCGFVDARWLAQTFGFRRRVTKPAYQADPILADAQAYGSVLRSPDGWRMWYLAATMYTEYYATSEDGLQWTRPSLNMVADPARTVSDNAFMAPGSRDAAGNWLVELQGPEGFCVLDAEVTPHPAAKRRFTALYLARFEHADRPTGLCVAYSDDGIHWHAEPANPVLNGWRDTAQAMLYDPDLQLYVLYGRPDVCVTRTTHANRLIARTTSPDLIHWSHEQIVLDTDDIDADAWEFIDESSMRDHDVAYARKRAWMEITEGSQDLDKPLVRGRNKQWYGLTPFRYAGMYLGFGWLYDIESGGIDIELLHSHDGIDWRREAKREPMIEIPANVCACTMSSPPIAMGTEYRLYYSHQNRNHHHQDAGVPAGIRVATVGRDRWVGYHAGKHEAELLTQVLDAAPRTLNAEVSTGGSINAELIAPDGSEIPGCSLSDGTTLTASGLDLPLNWAAIPPGEVRLRLIARNASIYGMGW